MILDRLSHMERYRGLERNFSKAVSFLQRPDVFSLPLGEFEIDGRSVYGFVKETGLTRENIRWEAHEKYADIQIILGGAERIGFVPFSSQPVAEPYNAEKDIAFFLEAGTGVECTLRPGDFMIFLPGELHRPDCPVPGEPVSRKMVIKVLVKP